VTIMKLTAVIWRGLGGAATSGGQQQSVPVTTDTD
jgi:hypothetical protein